MYQKTSTGGGGGGGGGMSEEKVLAMESRLSHHIQELRWLRVHVLVSIQSINLLSLFGHA